MRSNPTLKPAIQISHYQIWLNMTDCLSLQKALHLLRSRLPPLQAGEVGKPDVWAFLVIGEYYADGVQCFQPIGWTAQVVRYHAEGSHYNGVYKIGSDMAERSALTWAALWCCQETNLPQEDFATQMWVARQLGWNVIFIQSLGSNNGGLAVAVREPLAVVILAETSNDSGQMIQVEVHSSSVPFRLFNVYQRPGGWDPSISHPMLGLDNTPWVCCGDFNADVRSLGFGTLGGTARHTTSKHPIDGVFASEMFAQMKGAEHQSFGNDHSIAWASFQGTWVTPPGDSTIWTFRQNRQTQNAGLENEYQDREKFWVNSVCSQEEWHNCLQQDSEAIWAQWTKDFESFLVGT